MKNQLNAGHAQSENTVKTELLLELVILDTGVILELTQETIVLNCAQSTIIVSLELLLLLDVNQEKLTQLLEVHLPRIVLTDQPVITVKKQMREPLLFVLLVSTVLLDLPSLQLVQLENTDLLLKQPALQTVLIVQLELSVTLKE